MKTSGACERHARAHGNAEEPAQPADPQMRTVHEQPSCGEPWNRVSHTYDSDRVRVSSASLRVVLKVPGGESAASRLVECEGLHEIGITLGERPRALHGDAMLALLWSLTWGDHQGFCAKGLAFNSRCIICNTHGDRIGSSSMLLIRGVLVAASGGNLTVVGLVACNLFRHLGLGIGLGLGLGLG